MFARAYRHEDVPFVSRRSPVYGKNGSVASSQPLASEAGLRVLRNGGNAADAAVAMAAALSVTEPCSTGLGGDAFCLFYNSEAKSVKCLLGNGRSPAKLTLERIRQRGFGDGIPTYHALNVTCPGAAAAWCDISESWGKLKLSDALSPAIELARDGFPVSPITAYHWSAGCKQLLASGTNGVELLLPDGRGSYRAPQAGEVFKNPALASVLETLSREGKKGFYEGWIGKAITEAVALKGGVLSMEDLQEHRSSMEEPIGTTYQGVEIWQVPPPTQGMVALMALNLMEGYDSQMTYADRLHCDIECVKLAFAECVKHIADPEVASGLPVGELTSKTFADKIRTKINLKTAGCFGTENASVGNDTVYFCAVDKWGNGCSMINSNYMGFGTGIVPKGCGFSLQNRGHGFAPANSDQLNCVGPSKRPYHTIIPGMATFANRESLYATFGVMGGFMQPQGHAQVIRNLITLGMDPQQALDAPRFFVNVADYSKGETLYDTMNSATRQTICLEAHITEAIAEDLRSRGHEVESQIDGLDRAIFGRGQIIRRDPVSRVLSAGSDPRADGCAMSF